MANKSRASRHLRWRFKMFSVAFCTRASTKTQSIAAFATISKRKLHSTSFCSLTPEKECHVEPLSKTTPGFFLPSHPDTPIRAVMAPMVAASDYPFRLFLRKHCGVDLTYTQMLHSKNFCTDSKFRRAHLDLYEAGAIYNELVPAQLECLGAETALPTASSPARAPNMVQLAGHDVDLVVKTALMIMDHTNGGVTGFDLNCGCPQGIARKGRYGAFLMEEDDRLVCEILSALREALPPSVAVSAKVRLPLDDTTIEDRIPRLVGTGINFMAIHGRTLLENKTKVGAVHIDRMQMAIKAAHRVDPNFPVIANGGMEKYTDVQNILKSTGAVAAMSSESLLETPNIFMEESLDLTARQRLEQQFSHARNYLEICRTIAPPMPGVLGTSKAKGGSFSVVRGHIFKFLHRYIQENIDLRNTITEDRKITSIPQMEDLVEDFYDRYNSLSDEELESRRSSAPEASWYRRHRKPGRRVHQKDVKVGSSFSTKGEESLDDRKRRMRERIEKLQSQKAERSQSKVNRFLS